MKILSNNFSLFRTFLIIANDLFILNSVLFLSYFLRTEEFIYPIEVYVIYLFANIIYLFFFTFFEINKQYFRHFIVNSFGLYLKFFFILYFYFYFFYFCSKYKLFAKISIYYFSNLFFYYFVIK